VKYSVVFPIHNEAENIPELVARLRATMDAYAGPNDWEALMVDDHSSDDTLAVLCAEAARCPNIRVLVHKTNRGQTGGFATGFRNARGDVVVTMDADLQVLPEDVPRLLDKMAQRYDLVNAVRMKRQHEPLIRLSSRFYNLLMRLFFQCSVIDAASNFTAIRTEYVRGVRLVENDHRYIIPIVERRGGRRIAEVAVRHEARKHGKSKYGISKAFSGTPELLRAWRRLRTGFYDG
jgi:glycosyltransferase involved in cell wall biosynthesis